MKNDLYDKIDLIVYLILCTYHLRKNVKHMHIITGTLINKRYVITAMHCIQDKGVLATSVRVSQKLVQKC